MTAPQVRPAAKSIATSTELRRWYWTREELGALARHHGLKVSGAKFVLLERIAHFLETGTVPADVSKAASSKFDWANETLTRGTFITDNYKNTQNVRAFFEGACQGGFKFNIAFMDWMKASTGKTLGDAVAAYEQQKRDAQDPGHKTKIKAHNQFNQYTRDILAAHPELGMDEVRRIWKAKRQLPSETGRHVFELGDMNL